MYAYSINTETCCWTTCLGLLRWRPHGREGHGTDGKGTAMTDTPNTARVPSPPGAVRVETWRVTDDERVVRTFWGTEYDTDGVHIVIVGEQDYRGEVQAGRLRRHPRFGRHRA